MMSAVESVEQAAAGDMRAESVALVHAALLTERAHRDGKLAVLQQEEAFPALRAALDALRLYLAQAGPLDVSILPSDALRAWKLPQFAGAMEVALGRVDHKERARDALRGMMTGEGLAWRMAFEGLRRAPPARGSSLELVASTFAAPEPAPASIQVAVDRVASAVKELLASGRARLDEKGKCIRLLELGEAPTVHTFGEAILALAGTTTTPPTNSLQRMNALVARAEGLRHSPSAADAVRSVKAMLQMLQLELRMNSLTIVLDAATKDTAAPQKSVNSLAPLCTSIDGALALRLALLAVNPVPDQLRRVAVRPSEGKGNGVFADEDCEPGTLLTTYPSHALALRGVGGAGKVTWWSAWEKQLTHPEVELLSQYLMNIDRAPVAVAGDPDVYDPAQCGHILNDGACLVRRDFDKAELLEYIKASGAAQNCDIVNLAGCVIAVVATRAIRKGEECFIGYGAHFWAKLAV